MLADRNTVTITLTFSDADFDELDFVARVIGKTPDEVMATILGPDNLSKHVRDTLAGLRREHERLRRELPATVGALEAVARIQRKWRNDR